MPVIKPTNKYQLNAVVALAIGLSGFVAISCVAGLLSSVVPRQLAVGVGAALMIALVSTMKSKATITPSSLRILRTTAVIISICAIVAFGAAIAVSLFTDWRKVH